MNAAEVLVDALERHGVRYVFGIPGHGNTNILDAIHGSDAPETAAFELGYFFPGVELI